MQKHVLSTPEATSASTKSRKAQTLTILVDARTELCGIPKSANMERVARIAAHLTPTIQYEQVLQLSLMTRFQFHVE